MAEKKLFLLDAFALIYRAYFGFGKNHRYNSKGLNTSAILGFTNTLVEVLNKEQPTHIAVVFDAPTATNRELEYADYKANREEMPEDIRLAIPYIKQIIEAFNIPILLHDGYEADDIIGTLAKAAEKEGFVTFMMTPDKDFGQLVTEHIKMYKPARGGKPAEIWGVKEVCEQFQITDPLQVIDILGLWGDAVDNIPGIPGIGEKTSKKLISQYGSVENLIANADELKGKQKENVIAFAEQGLLSKRLATIILDAPVPFDQGALAVKEKNKDQLRELFATLEFRTMAQRVLGEEIAVKQVKGGQLDMFSQEGDDAPAELVTSQSIDQVDHQYLLVGSAERRAALLEELLQQSSVCFDTETTGIDPHTAELVGLSFSFQSHKAYYVPVPEDREEATAVVNEFLPFWQSESIEKVAQNIKYDISVLDNYGVEVKGPLFDTMIAHYLMQPDMKHGMDVLSEAYLNYKPISIETLIGEKGKQQKSMRDLPPGRIKDYAAEDADVTWQLMEKFRPKMEEDHLKKLFHEVEMPLTRVLAEMEAEGIRLDVDALASFSDELQQDITQLHGSIIEAAGVDFNIDSPKQLGQVLFDHMKIVDQPKKTKTGQYATNEDVLTALAHEHAIVNEILEYRSLRKLKSTYVDVLPQLCHPEDWSFAHYLYANSGSDR